MIEDTLFKILHELEKLTGLLSPKDAAPVPTPKIAAAADKPAPPAETKPATTAAPAPTREEVGKKLIELATKKNRAAAETVLQKFGAAKLDGVAVEQYPAFYAAIVAELG
jgi:hypothetical protein